MSTDSLPDLGQREPARVSQPRLLERRGGGALVVLLLTLGAFVAPVVGWLVGVVLLWSSFGWSRLDKAIGTAVGPVAFGVPLLLRLLHPDVEVVGCSTSDFCAPSWSPAWYQSTAGIGTWLLLAHLALGIHLLLRFRVGGGPRRPTPPGTHRDLTAP